MGTRATYRFTQTDGNGPKSPVTVYHHWDGYPSGAAELFAAAVANPHNGELTDDGKPKYDHETVHRGAGAYNLASRFIRANAHAMLTKSHNAHSDTEWRYDVAVDPTGIGQMSMAFGRSVVKVYKRERWHDSKTGTSNDQWKLLWKDNLAAFVASAESFRADGM
jgi:hypothetical protein